MEIEITNNNTEESESLKYSYKLVTDILLYTLEKECIKNNLDEAKDYVTIVADVFAHTIVHGECVLKKIKTKNKSPRDENKSLGRGRLYLKRYHKLLNDVKKIWSSYL